MVDSATAFVRRYYVQGLVIMELNISTTCMSRDTLYFQIFGYRGCHIVQSFSNYLMLMSVTLYRMAAIILCILYICSLYGLYVPDWEFESPNMNGSNYTTQIVSRWDQSMGIHWTSIFQWAVTRLSNCCPGSILHSVKFFTDVNYALLGTCFILSTNLPVYSLVFL